MFWESIDTAPKDGTKIIGYDSHNDEWYAMWWKEYAGHASLSEWQIDGVRGYEWEFDVNPTHWMPLPPPPAGSP